LPGKIIDDAGMNRLQSHHWPGNVRELENLVRRLAALYSQEIIGIEVIEAELSVLTPPQTSEKSDGNIGETIENHLQEYFHSHGNTLPPDGLYNRILKEVERPLITLSLAATRGNQLKASNLLGLNRNTLRKKIHELDILVTKIPK